MERSYLDSEQFSDAGKTLTPDQARFHCILSLLLRYAAPVVFLLFIQLPINVHSYGEDTLFFTTLPTIFVIAAYIFSWGLMISVRRHNKDYKFGEVLMFLYIFDTIAAILFVFISITKFLNEFSL